MNAPPDDDPGEDAGGLKRKLILRATLAALLVVALLGGLALFEGLNQPPPPPIARQTPAPLAMPAPPAPVPVSTPAESPPTPAPPPVPEETRAPELVPPAQRHADGPPPLATGARLVVSGESVAPPSPAPAAQSPQPGPPARSAPAVAGHGYQIQLGVFGTLENAQALQAALAAEGIPARVESRVVVGPFEDRTAAKAAQARLRKAGHGAGVLVPPRPASRHAG
ncbi:MAG: SPOR domain-containing protein [Zoogloeaceae bacterium]|nr:SPOR domain-containing protein [Zoogloeaceae bacterium]